MNLFRKTKSVLIIILLFLLACGASILSLVLYQENNSLANTVSAKTDYLASLEDQISILRNENHSLSAQFGKPNLLPYFENTNRALQNKYDLDCSFIDGLQRAIFNSILQPKGSEKEHDFYSCTNKDLNQAVVITQKEIKPATASFGGIAAYNFYILDLSKQSKEFLVSQSGDFISSWCKNIIAWSKNDSLYYECSTNSNLSEQVTFKTGIKSKKTDQIQTCTSKKGILSCTAKELDSF